MREGKDERTRVAPPPAVRISGDTHQRGAGKVRFAVGLFERADRAAEALCELSGSGVVREDINVFANESAIAGIIEATGKPGAAKAMPVARWIVCRPSAGTYPWAYELVAESGAPASRCLARDEMLAVDLHHWVLARQAEQVNDSLRSDGGVIVVRTSDDRQQQAVCAVLLRHASSRVQTHDIRSPHTAANIL